jgi:hypothetical protein
MSQGMNRDKSATAEATNKFSLAISSSYSSSFPLLANTGCFATTPANSLVLVAAVCCEVRVVGALEAKKESTNSRFCDVIDV